MLWRYLGAALGAAATLSADSYGRAGQAIAGVAAAVTDAVQTTLTPYIPEGAAALAGGVTPGLAALLVGAAVRATSQIRRLISLGVGLIAIAAFAGAGPDIPVGAAILLGAALIMNLAAGPLLVAPLSAVTVSLAVSILRTTGGTILSGDILDAGLEQLVATLLAAGAALLAAALVLRR